MAFSNEMKKIKMNLLSIVSVISLIFLNIYITTSVGGSNSSDNLNTNYYCPVHCICDLFQNLNHANCSGQQLISANVEVPAAVELLNLSNNDITILDNESFKSFHFLINITIAYNAIHTIYLDAFSPLHSIKSIDLSYNRLEYFDDRIFERNSHLIELNLSGNKLTSLRNKPLIRSSSLRYLNLQNSQITHIYKDLFAEIINLNELDISKNLMITINIAPFSYLGELKKINLAGNRWICDKNLDATVGKLRRRGVHVTLFACAFEMKKTFEGGKRNSSKIQLERMIMLPTEQQSLSEEEKSSRTNIQMIWKNHMNIKSNQNEICDDESWEENCQKLQICLSSVKALLKDRNPENGMHYKMYTANDLNFVFLTGVSLGIAIVICIMSCALCIKHCCESRSKLPEMNNIETVNSIEYRRHVARSRRSNHRSLVNTNRQNGNTMESPNQRSSSSSSSDFTTFIASLFERPTRHQYYRTLNRNTATLIRRLSRSNLFTNNRQSQYFSDNPNATAPELPHTLRGNEHEHLVTMNGRPETPPPSYREIVNT